MATLRQIAANQENAKHSTGPASDDGKARSRRNALKHGLAGAGVVLPDEEAEALAQRIEAWRPNYNPANDEQEWLLSQLVASSLQIDHCRTLDAAVRTEISRRALLSWDDDRRLDAENLLDRLPRKPATLSRQIRRTKQGGEALINRWQALATEPAWTEPLAALAFNLLGAPPEFRDPHPGAPDESPAQLAQREIARLENLRDTTLDDLDAAEREAAELGLEVQPSRPLNLLRRYEAAAHRRHQWARNRLLHPDQTPTPPNTPVERPSITPLLPEPDETLDYATLDREILHRLIHEPNPAFDAYLVAQKPSVPPPAADSPLRLRDSALPKVNRKMRRAAHRLVRSQ